jgi:hypothetical protein
MEDATNTAAGATCIRCGTVFSCNPTGVGTCWCMEKAPRPVPSDAKRCYCPSCFDLVEPARMGDAAAL